MSNNQRHWDPWKMYDTTPEELRAIRERAKARQALKAEWTKKYTNPWKGAQDGGHLFDPAIQRYISLKATQAERFRGTFRSGVFAFGFLVLPIAILTFHCIKTKEDKERRYRNGEVMYKDRQDKFFY